jgi:hypothetical protein
VLTTRCLAGTRRQSQRALSVGHGGLESVTTPDVQGLEQLEHAVQNDTASLATALRRCLRRGWLRPPRRTTRLGAKGTR